MRDDRGSGVSLVSRSQRRECAAWRCGLRGNMRLGCAFLLVFFIRGSYAGWDLEVNVSRVLEDLDRLAFFSDTPAPAITRVIFTEADLKARHFLLDLFRDEGLQVREDAMGNIFARWLGTDDDAAVGAGSHFDAIPLSGMYDGTVGVLGALEAVRALKAASFSPKRSIEILAFTSEEPTRFGIGCIGSRVLSGALSVDDLVRLKDNNGTSFDAARQQAALVGKLCDVELAANYYHSFVELHIEQGPILEAEAVDVGVVAHIAAPAQLEVVFEGDGGHAGAQLMPDRNDALLAGAELALEVERAALATASVNSVATTGTFVVGPNAVNSVPRVATLGIDVRDVDGARRDNILRTVEVAAARIAAARRVRHRFVIFNQDAPATCSLDLVNSLEAAAEKLRLSHKRMVSRAYHDSLFLARRFPVAMLFIPCRDGISHRPDEYSSPEAIANGIKVLGLTLANLSESSDAKDEL